MNNQLGEISNSLKDINKRLDTLEKKTDDIHQYIPLICWLEGFCHTFSRKWSWVQGLPEVPRVKKPINK